MTVRLHDPHHPAPFRWAGAGEGDCPHVLDAERIRFYCTGNRDHRGDHAAEGNSGTVAEWATGDPGASVDEEAARIIADLAASVDEALAGVTANPDDGPRFGRYYRRTRRLRRKGRK